MAERKLYVEENNGHSFREPTIEELVEAMVAENERSSLIEQEIKIQKRLKELSKHPSKVFYDDAGFPNDFRIFIASGKVDLI